MEEALQGEKFEDVDDQVLEEEYTEDDDGVEELLAKADPETLEEVAKELGIEKQVDIEDYNPYTDTRDDIELTDDELSARTNMKLYSPDGKLAANRKIKKVTIKNKEDNSTQ
jgi:phosphotransacetylase